MAHTCDLSSWEAKAGGLLQVECQPGLNSKILTQKNFFLIICFCCFLVCVFVFHFYLFEKNL